MKVKTITLEGQTGFTAVINREKPARGPECIFCEIADAKGERVAIHHVSADDRDDMYSMAECIQYQLDGYHGTNSEKHDYFRFIELFGD